VSFTGRGRSVLHFGFTRSNGEKLVAFWVVGLDGKTVLLSFHDDILIKDVKGKGATIIDTLNGTETPLKTEQTPDGWLYGISTYKTAAHRAAAN